MFKVFVTDKIDKELRKLHPKDAKKVTKSVQKLVNPYTKNLNIRKVEDEEGFWRLRVGKVRIIYEIDKKQKLVILRRIAYRGQAPTFYFQVQL